MAIKIWGKLDKKLSRFWGLPTGKGTRYPYNDEYKVTDDEWAAKLTKRDLKKLKEGKSVRGRKISEEVSYE